jgi:hypothetical protein
MEFELDFPIGEFRVTSVLEELLDGIGDVTLLGDAEHVIRGDSVGLAGEVATTHCVVEGDFKLSKFCAERVDALQEPEGYADEIGSGVDWIGATVAFKLGGEGLGVETCHWQSGQRNERWSPGWARV